MLSTDLHIHTSCSKDGESSVQQVLSAAIAAGLDAIAITDHDTMQGYKIARELDTSVLVIPGVEISTREGHVIALGIETAPNHGQPVLDTIKMVQDKGGITILPHPFHRYRHGAALKCPESFRISDAIEVYNSRYVIPHANQRAMRLAKKLDKPAVAGSDAHNARFVGYGRTLIDAEKNIEDILQAIKEGKTQPAGRKTPIRTYTKQSLRNSWRKIRGRIHQ
ncbi:MAG: PHP domain-containing protein [Methanomicrobiales archaeon]|nr:PHP domain-containing protein [Methanomicrobiales archaeon]